MDFMTRFPKVVEQDTIMMIEDKLTKQAMFVPCTQEVTMDEVPQLFFDNQIRHTTFPQEIVTIKRLVFQTTFWKHTMSKTRVPVGVNLTMTMAWHPQGKGKTHKINSILNMYMTSFCKGDQFELLQLLPLGELCYNTTQSVSYDKRPFYLYYALEATQASELYFDRSESY